MTAIGERSRRGTSARTQFGETLLEFRDLTRLVQHGGDTPLTTSDAAKMIVYKYLPPCRIDVLENAAIRFTQPAAFNDPFETLPSFALYREGQKKEFLTNFKEQDASVFSALGVDPEAVFDIARDGFLSRSAEQWSQCFGILSLSRCRDNPLMWSHYADCHRGYIIGFDSTDSFFNPENGKAIDGLREVKYSAHRAMLPELGFQFSTLAEVREANEYIFFTKSADWAYEQEMRILADPNRADHTIPTEVEGGWKCCLFSFPPTAVREIIIGSRMAHDGRAKLVSLWKQRYSHAELYRTALSPTDFAMEIRPMRQGDLLGWLQDHIAGQSRLIRPS